MKKFELTTEFITSFLGTKLFRIKTLVKFGDVEKGELGGFVEKEENLEHYGNAWVSGGAIVFGDARVSGDAIVYEGARVYGNAKVSGCARVYGNARVSGDALVTGYAMVSGHAQVSGYARVYGDAEVSGCAIVSEYARVHEDALVCGNTIVRGDAIVSGDALVCGDQMYATVKGFGSKCRDTTFFVTKDGNVCVNCGCFSGTLEQFREKVKETHKDTEFAKEYLVIADLMEMHFKEELEKIKKQ